MDTSLRRIIAYSALSMLLAGLIDAAAYLLGGLTDSLATLVWGAARMYTRAASAVLVAGPGVLRRSLRLGMRVFIYFLASPLIVFAALLFYILITASMGFFTLEPLRGLTPPQITDKALLP
ncbi:MAG: hypothetical protein QW555_06930 [Nitrososphaerota archaeon]